MCCVCLFYPFNELRLNSFFPSSSNLVLNQRNSYWNRINLPKSVQRNSGHDQLYDDGIQRVRIDGRCQSFGNRCGRNSGGKRLHLIFTGRSPWKKNFADHFNVRSHGSLSWTWYVFVFAPATHGPQFVQLGSAVFILTVRRDHLHGHFTVTVYNFGRDSSGRCKFIYSIKESCDLVYRPNFRSAKLAALSAWYRSAFSPSSRWRHSQW